VASHSSSSSAMAADYDEVTTASIRAIGGSFPSIGVTVKARDSTAETIGHSGVHTVARCVAELR
jgi:predicted lysophospholipase L1 biosynthesis ABC-type transport system permease subunit